MGSNDFWVEKRKKLDSGIFWYFGPFLMMFKAHPHGNIAGNSFHINSDVYSGDIAGK